MTGRKATRTLVYDQLNGDRMSDNPDLQENSRKQEIIRTASTLFSGKGYHNTTMDEIAQIVDMRKPSLYYYFASKEDMLWYILEGAVSRLLEDARNAVSGNSLGPMAKLEALLKVHVGHVQSSREAIIVFLNERSALTDARGARYLAWRRDYDQMYLDVIQDGQRKRVFRQADARLLSYGILGMYNWMVQWFDPNGAMTVEEIHNVFWPLAIDGLSQTRSRRLG